MRHWFPIFLTQVHNAWCIWMWERWEGWRGVRKYPNLHDVIKEWSLMWIKISKYHLGRNDWCISIDHYLHTFHLNLLSLWEFLLWIVIMSLDVTKFFLPCLLPSYPLPDIFLRGSLFGNLINILQIKKWHKCIVSLRYNWLNMQHFIEHIIYAVFF